MSYDPECQNLFQRFLLCSFLRIVVKKLLYGAAHTFKVWGFHAIKLTFHAIKLTCASELEIQTLKARVFPHGEDSNRELFRGPC